jgi:hypothetical protein
VIDFGLVLPPALRDKIGEDAAFAYYSSRFIELNERSSTLARNGLAGSPDYADIVQDRFVVIRELVSLGLPEEQAEREWQAAIDNDVIEYLVGNIVSRYSAYDLREAADMAFCVVHDPDLHLGLDPATLAVATFRAVRALEEARK